MSVHEGHRERLKETFRSYGLDSFNEISALELLLFYAIPRRDTNELAHELINRFGSLENVLNASERQLTEVTGMGQNAATLLRLVPEIMRKCEIEKAKRTITIIGNSKDAGRYLLPRFMNETVEVVWLMCLDSKREVVFCGEMCRGIVNAIDTNIRKFAETAFQYKATTVIVAHNHPSGIALPSREDDMFTKKLYNAMRAIGVTLEDHLIIAGSDYISFADSGMMALYRF